jgi:flagellar biosynthesis protein
MNESTTKALARAPNQTLVPSTDPGTVSAYTERSGQTYERAKQPTAVALHYSGRGAPRVTAKGDGHIARRIIETARQHNVPLEEDAALASALSRVELGREIPRDLWIAVAHVLAFAWTVAGKKKPT